MKSRRRQLAFTLIEFLIALVIIGFIVAILVGVFSSPVAESRLSSRASTIIDNFNVVSAAIDRYEMATGKDFAYEHGWRDDGTWGNEGNGQATLVDGGYLTALPEIFKLYGVRLYLLYPCELDGDGKPNDRCFWIDNMPEDECRAINTARGLAAPVEQVSGNETIEAASTQGSNIFCFKHPSWGWEGIFIKSRTP